MTELKRGFLRSIYLQIPLKPSSPRAQQDKTSAERTRSLLCKRRRAGLVGASPFSPSTGNLLAHRTITRPSRDPPELNANLPIQLVPAVSLRNAGWRPGSSLQVGEDIGLCYDGWHWGFQILPISLLSLPVFPWSEKQFYHTLPPTMDFPNAGPKAMCQITTDWSLQSH